MTDKQFQSPRAGAHAPEKKKRIAQAMVEQWGSYVNFYNPEWYG